MCRHELYPSYKAQRPAPPDEFHDAGPVLEQIFKLMGLPMLGIPGVEADDLIGTFAYPLSESWRLRCRGVQ